MSRLAVSNIAWPAEDERAARATLRRAGITAIEVAPTRAWPHPADASSSETAAYRQALADDGLEIVAMQALLFGRDDLVIFESEAKREATLEYLTAIFRIAGELGARPLVFGSPKNRRVAGLSPREVDAIAIPFFRAAGAAAAAHGSALCLEANPTEYGCDYLTTSTQCIELLEKVGSSGLGLHLDTAGMTLAREPIAEAVRAAAPWLRHFHISEPFLAPVGTGHVDHEEFARALAAIRYGGWLSIEMRALPEGRAVAGVDAAVKTARAAYSAVLTPDSSAA